MWRELYVSVCGYACACAGVYLRAHACAYLRLFIYICVCVSMFDYVCKREYECAYSVQLHLYQCECVCVCVPESECVRSNPVASGNDFRWGGGRGRGRVVVL